MQITEVMYDTPGSDAGREWVEITNTGLENIDVGKYKLFENDTNHGLKLVSGSSTLTPGASAVLASDAAKFLIDYPNFSGILFDTAFALSNTGESLAIKDASSTVLSTIEYSALEDANGTGGSLQLQRGALT
ncbi:MAG: lamin tail domain-containing protein, partial [Patescibacteria group bacterium]